MDKFTLNFILTVLVMKSQIMIGRIYINAYLGCMWVAVVVASFKLPSQQFFKEVSRKMGEYVCGSVIKTYVSFT